jgi:hypothetical protein
MLRHLFQMNARETLSFCEGMLLAFMAVYVRGNLKLGILVVATTLGFNALRRWVGPLRPS